MSDVRLVVLDVGGVLVRTGRTWEEDASLAGFRFEREWFASFEARRRRLPSLSRGEVSAQRYCELVAGVSEGALSADDVRRITAASLVGEYATAPVVFDVLAQAGIETALLMNLNEIEWSTYFPDQGGSAFPTLSRAVYRFSSHLIGATKPDAAAYEHVGRETGHSGRDVLFFDDRAENVSAAIERGWRAEVIDDSVDPPRQVLEYLRTYGVSASA